MNQTWLMLISISFFIVCVVFISVLIELRKSAKALTEFLKTTENSIGPALDELQDTLKSLRKVTDDINEVTENVRTVSGAASDIGRNFKKISDLLSEVSSDTLIKVSGLRVGIRTALEFLLKNIIAKKGGSQ